MSTIARSRSETVIPYSHKIERCTTPITRTSSYADINDAYYYQPRSELTGYTPFWQRRMYDDDDLYDSWSRRYYSASNYYEPKMFRRYCYNDYLPTYYNRYITPSYWSRYNNYWNDCYDSPYRKRNFDDLSLNEKRSQLGLSTFTPTDSYWSTPTYWGRLSTWREAVKDLHKSHGENLQPGYYTRRYRQNMGRWLY